LERMAVADQSNELRTQRIPQTYPNNIDYTLQIQEGISKNTDRNVCVEKYILITNNCASAARQEIQNTTNA